MKTNDPRRPAIGFAVSVRDDAVSYARIVRPDAEALGCLSGDESSTTTIPSLPISDIEVPGAVPCDSAEVVRELARASRRRETAPWVPLAGVFVVWIVIAVVFLAGGGLIAVAIAIAAAVFVTWIGHGVAKRSDAASGASLLVYRLDEASAERFAGLLRATLKLAAAERMWHIASEGRLIDPKQKLGARRFLRRYRMRPGLSTPLGTLMNVRIPTVYGESRRYFFLPDRVLVFDKRGARSISYDRLTARTEEVLVVEDEDVPFDARIVETTWLHPGLDGGPDPAVHNNRRHPIVLYGALELVGSLGAPDLFHASVPAALEAFAAALERMADDSEDADDDVNADAVRDESRTEAAGDDVDDELIDSVLRFITNGGRCDVGSIVKRFEIPFGAAARVLATIEQDGFIGPLRPDGLHEVRRSAARYVMLLELGPAGSADSSSRKKTFRTSVRRRRGRTLEPHEVLGVAPSATRVEIAEAYRELARLYHPDKVAALAPEFVDLADQRMKEINAAYTALVGDAASDRRAGGR